MEEKLENNPDNIRMMIKVIGDNDNDFYNGLKKYFKKHKKLSDKQFVGLNGFYGRAKD